MRAHESSPDLGGWITYTGRHTAYVDPFEECLRRLDETEEILDRLQRALDERPPSTAPPRSAG